MQTAEKGIDALFESIVGNVPGARPLLTCRGREPLIANPAGKDFPCASHYRIRRSSDSLSIMSFTKP